MGGLSLAALAASFLSLVVGPALLSRFPGAGDDPCPLGLLGMCSVAVTRHVDPSHPLGKVQDGVRRARDQAPRIGDEEVGEGRLR